MSAARKLLPSRRASVTFGIEVNGLKFTATASRFSDGRLAEIFISNSKSGSHLDTAAKDSAVVCSIALQFGVPPELIRQALCRDASGRATGPLGVALDAIADEEAAP
jgi:hypothetical protein